MMKIEIGSGGNTKRPGYMTQDIRDVPGVDIVCDAMNLRSKLEDNTVEEFYSRHFFEHLTFTQGRKLLEDCLLLLKPGGFMEMMLPDLEYHCRQYLDPNKRLKYFKNKPSNPNHHEHALAGFYGWQRDGDKDFWDVHKSGYSYEDLKELLENVGYKNIERIPNKPWNLQVKAKKDV